MTGWRNVKLTTPSKGACVPVSRVRDNLGLGNDHDSALKDLIRVASTQVENELGRALMETSFTLHLDAWPGREVIFPWAPLLAITSVKYYDQSTETLTTFASSKYTVDIGADPGRLWLNEDQDWPELQRRPSPIEILFTAGFGTKQSDVPETIRHAVVLLASHFFEENLPVVVGTTAAKIPFTIERLLAPERHLRF